MHSYQLIAQRFRGGDLECWSDGHNGGWSFQINQIYRYCFRFRQNVRIGDVDGGSVIAAIDDGLGDNRRVLKLMPHTGFRFAILEYGQTYGYPEEYKGA